MPDVPTHAGRMHANQYLIFGDLGDIDVPEFQDIGLSRRCPGPLPSSSSPPFPTGVVAPNVTASRGVTHPPTWVVFETFTGESPRTAQAVENVAFSLWCMRMPAYRHRLGYWEQ